MLPPFRSRVFGLDLMRAVAILLVVASHADDLLDAHWPSDPGMAALDGVDLFFVLSGFLIGSILLRMCMARHIPFHRRLVDFWQRRWLRTLPNYFLFLLLNVALLYLGLAPGLLNMNVLAYFVFLQNFIIPLDLFFWESWSLAVEEWFYLLFPLSLAVTIGWWRRTPRYAFLAAVLLMLIIPAFLRFPAMDKVGTPFLLDLWVRKVVVLRLDTIGFGVLMAWVAFHAPAFFTGRRVEMFALGSIGLSTAILLRGGGDLMYMGTWFFTISGVSMALMIPLLANWQRTGKWGSIIEFLSRISYALYLVHMPVRHLYMELMVGRSAGASVLLYVGYWVLCLLISVLVHRYWERPWMALREPLSQRLLTMEVRSGRTPSPSS